MIHDFRDNFTSIKSSVSRYLAKIETRRNAYTDLETENRSLANDLRTLNARLMLRDDRCIYTRRAVNLLTHITQNNQRKQELLNQMEAFMAKAAALIAYGIDIDLQNDVGSFFSTWAKLRIYDMDAKKIIIRNEEETVTIQFPTAVGILAPYIFKTQSEDNRFHYAGVRNAIRKFIDV